MKRLFLGLLFLADCFGQNTGQNVVNFPVIAQQTITSPTTFTSINLQNIGQTSHEVIVNVTALTLSGGVTATITLHMLASIDGVTYFDISSATVQSLLVGGNIFKAVGYLSYPFLKTQVVINTSPNPPGVGNLSVSLNGLYVGTSNPSAILIDSNSTSSPINVLSNSLATANPGRYIAPTAGKSIVIYGFDINTDGTTTLVHLYCTSDNAAGSINDLNVQYIPFWLTTAQTLIWPQSVRPYAVCPIGDALWYRQTGTNPISMTLRYRSE